MFRTRSGGQGDLDDDAEINVTHFIPSVHLKGRRADKIQTLDTLIDHLEGLRRSLTGRSPVPREWRGEPSAQFTRTDRWWAAGLLVAASLVLVMFGVRACTTTNDNGFSVGPQRGVARLLPARANRTELPRPFDVRNSESAQVFRYAREFSGPRTTAN